MTAADEATPTLLQRRMMLPALLADVVSARDGEEALACARVRGVESTELADARRTTLNALVAYAAAIEALAWPVPRRVTMEIEMHRILCRTQRS